MNLQIRQCEITDAKAIHDLNLRVFNLFFCNLEQPVISSHSLKNRRIFKHSKDKIKQCMSLS